MAISCLVIKADMRSIFRRCHFLHVSDDRGKPLLGGPNGIISAEQRAGWDFTIHQEHHSIDVEILSLVDEKDGVVGCCSGQDRFHLIVG